MIPTWEVVLGVCTHEITKDKNDQGNPISDHCVVCSLPFYKLLTVWEAMVPMRCVCACVSVKQRCCITRRQFHSPSPQRVLLHFWIFRQTKAHPQLKITYSTCLFFLPSLATFYTLYLLSSSLSPSSSFSYHYSHCEHFILSSLSQCLYLLLLRWYTYSQFRCWPNYVSCLSLIHLTVLKKKYYYY